MCLWPWAILHPATAPLGAGPTYTGSAPCGQPLPDAPPPNPSPGACIVMAIVWVLGYRGCFFGDRMRSGGVHSAKGGQGVSLPLAGQSSKGLWTELHPVLLRNCPRPAKCGFWNQMGHPSSPALGFLPSPQGPSSLGKKFSVLGFVLRALTSSYRLSVQSQAHSRCLTNICLVIMATIARGR